MVDAGWSCHTWRTYVHTNVEVEQLLGPNPNKVEDATMEYGPNTNEKGPWGKYCPQFFFASSTKWQDCFIFKRSRFLEHKSVKKLVVFAPEVVIDGSRIFHPKDEDILWDNDGIEEHKGIGLDSLPDQAYDEANV
jgi:hypothetical protein